VGDQHSNLRHVLHLQDVRLEVECEDVDERRHLVEQEVGG